jgi:hypothetical protein
MGKQLSKRMEKNQLLDMPELSTRVAEEPPNWGRLIFTGQYPEFCVEEKLFKGVYFKG